MQGLWRRLWISIVILIGSICLAILVFDILIVRPVVSQFKNTLSQAQKAESVPPQVVTKMLRKAYGSRLKYALTRNVLLASNQVNGMKTMHRQLTEFGVGTLLPLHLSVTDIESSYISSAYMGKGIYGFPFASEHYFGVPLSRVSTLQAARLVAISYAPTAYLSNPERLERRVQALVSQYRSAD